MQVRPATDRDAEAVAGLYTQLNQTNAALQPTHYRVAQGSKGGVKSILRNEDAAILVAEEEGQVLGFVRVAQRQAPLYDAVAQPRQGELTDIVVDEKARGQGVGTALVQAAKGWARQRGLASLELQVLKENEAAQRLYRRCAFGVARHTMRCQL